MFLTRMRILCLSMGSVFFGSCAILSVQSDRTECPKIGAIRWDAWYGEKDPVGQVVQQSLGPQRWHYRLPFCGKILSASEVEIDCSSQTVMDQEIEYARVAGIDYWAFVAYPPDDPLSIALILYLSNHKKDKLNFAMISESDRWGGPTRVAGIVERFVTLMREPTYQRVLDNRPLFFLGFIHDADVRKLWGGDKGFSEAIRNFRESAINAGVGNPYIVVMDFDPRRAHELRQRFGFDAVSSYATQENAKRGPYSELVFTAQRFWEAAKNLDEKVVPTVMAGWDRRPRVETTLPWERDRAEAGDAVERYYETPSPPELAGHLQEAISWVSQHQYAAAANTVLIYAWNEYDEGGWIAPTLLGGDARIRAIGNMLRVVCSRS